MTYKLNIFFVRKIGLLLEKHRSGSKEPDKAVATDEGERHMIGYFESECAAKLLTSLELELDSMETVKYALRNIDEQQGRLADMKIVVQEVERQVANRFAQQRKSKYS